MRKRIFVNLLWFALVMGASTIHAQDGDGRQKIESNKIGYITNRINLTTDQAPQFWPVYNEYSGKKQELQRKIRQFGNKAVQPGTAEPDVLRSLNQSNDAKQKLADLDQEYMPRFLKVISVGQYAELQNAERTFNKMLIERLNKDK
ncbi:MAG: hypothetical protein EAZ91_11670 [Cytophagales bacterium]|nr:MAG: hypothetical protein EAZ91_11670 [Cytophagales bacterium]